MGTTLRHIENYVSEATDFDFGAGIAQATRPIVGLGGVSNVGWGTVKSVGYQINFANYTSVTVKAQVRINPDSAWTDLSGASTGTNDAIVLFSTLGETATAGGPYLEYRLHVTATLSGSADTMTVDIVEEVED